MSGSDPVRPPASDVRFTYDAFRQFPDDGKRHELIDGEHVVSAAPNLRHQGIAVDLTGLLWVHLRANPVGKVLSAPVDVVPSDCDVVEIGSPSTRKRDETITRRLYERFGVGEYWVVEPELDEIKVYRSTDGWFAGVAELALERDEVLESPPFPGLALRLSEIFEE